MRVGQARSCWAPVFYIYTSKMLTWYLKYIPPSYPGLSSVLSSGFGKSCWNLERTTQYTAMIFKRKWAAQTKVEIVKRDGVVLTAKETSGISFIFLFMKVFVIIK